MKGPSAETDAQIRLPGMIYLYVVHKYLIYQFATSHLKCHIVSYFREIVAMWVWKISESTGKVVSCQQQFW